MIRIRVRIELATPAVVAVLMASLVGCGGGFEPIAEVRGEGQRVTNPRVETSVVDQLTLGRLQFALDLHRALAAAEPARANVVTSPHSLAHMLTMAYAGARGGTAAEMRAVLRLPEDADAVHRAANRLDLALLKAAGAEETTRLNLANALFVNVGREWEKPFLTVLQTQYGSGLYTLDFGGDPAGARRRINEWVAEQTERRISAYLPEGVDVGALEIMIVNATAFDGKWKHPFEPYKTDDRHFHTIGGTRVSVPTMSNAFFHSALVDDEGWTVAALPYRCERFELVLMLPPKDGPDIRAAEAALAAERITGWLGALAGQEPRWFSVSLPRVDTRSRYRLNDALKSLGMQQTFEEADLSGMITLFPPLTVRRVGQEVLLQVGEEGTTAVAVSDFAADNAAVMADDHVEMILDRPFLLLLRERETNAPLFFGRIGDPRH